jgi:acyl dehydratase
VLTAPPSLPRLYGQALLTSLVRGGDALPDTSLGLDGQRVDPDRLAGYDRVCGFRLTDELPVTYPHVLAFPLAMQLMADRPFPLPLPGLVHIRNEIVQRRPLTLSDQLSVRVRATQLRPHARGTQVDLLAEVRGAGELVWSGTSTYLARGRSVGGQPTDGRSDDGEMPPVPPDRVVADWSVPTDIGRRYAAVSGDVNPIHLHPWSAKLFGFPRSIAHGMWAAARCLAAFEGRLPAAATVQVAFRKPLLLPSRVRLCEEPTDGGWRFSLYGSRDDRVHLVGVIRPG